MIKVDNVTKRFGAFAALKGVSLDVRKGEFLALLGPSGSGKTTLLRIIAGLDFADSGSVLFDGADVSSLPVAERGVGFMFQHYALFKHMTVAENVGFGLSVRKRRDRPKKADIAARAQELLELVQLGHIGKRYPAQLSGGQRQRVALARALATDPTLLLLDEPFGALDAKVRKDLRRWLRELHEQMGLTSIFVTHDQEEALELADRVVVMDHGVMEQVGTPEEIYMAPGSSFVSDFVGETNRLPVTLSGGKVLLRGQPIDVPTAANGDGPLDLHFRPHDAALAQAQAAGSVPLHVSNVYRKGAFWRVEGRIDGHDRPIEVDLASSTPAPQPGETVGLTITRAKLFTPLES